MGRMTDEMTRLCDEILAGRGMRADFLAGVKDAVESLREETEQLRAGFRRAHEDMAASVKEAREEAVDQIKDRVAELNKQNADMRRAMRQALDQMARDQRAERNGFIANLAEAVTTMLDGFFDARTSMAAEMQSRLDAFRDGLERAASAVQKETADLRAAMRKAQADSARDSRQARLSFLADQVAIVNQFMNRVADMMAGIRRDQETAAAEDRGSRLRFVSELRTEVAGQQARFAQDRRRMAQEMADQLKSFEEEIKLHVKELMAAVEAMQRDFSEDLAGARAAWQGRKAARPTLVRAKQTPENAPPETPAQWALEKEPAPAGKQVSEAPVAEEVEPSRPEVEEPGAPRMEQLTVIKGIGPRLQSKLYMAGIDTLAKLAQSDPAKLREILGQAARTANVENWIAQAKKLI